MDESDLLMKFGINESGWVPFDRTLLKQELRKIHSNWRLISHFCIFEIGYNPVKEASLDDVIDEFGTLTPEYYVSVRWHWHWIKDEFEIVFSRIVDQTNERRSFEPIGWIKIGEIDDAINDLLVKFEQKIGGL